MSTAAPLALTVAELVLAVAPELARDVASGDDLAAWLAAHHATGLALSSLQVVQLVDLIESTFDLTLTSADVVRANFASADALVALLVRRGGDAR